MAALEPAKIDSVYQAPRDADNPDSHNRANLIRVRAIFPAEIAAESASPIRPAHFDSRLV